MVFVPKEVKLAVYKHLFKNNGITIPETNRTCQINIIKYKDASGNDVHPRNLYVNMVLKSLESRKYIKDTYAWRHHYFMLTDEGEKFIRQELDISEFTRPDPCSKQLAANFEPAQRPREGVEAKAE